MLLSLTLQLTRIGLWVLSGQGCAGLCGPRYRWEEEDAEKTIGAMADTFAEGDTLPWTWRECTLLRVIDAYEFCLTNKLPRGISEKKDSSRSDSAPFDGIDKVFAAVGLGQGERPARRGVLSEGLFDSPQPAQDVPLSESRRESPNIDPPAPAVQTRERDSAGPSAPLGQLPYPFTGQDAQISSEDVVPFPPSPEPEVEVQPASDEGAEGEEDFEEGFSGEADDSEMASDDRRTSGSMSSLGQPVTSRYPFQFRRPRARGGSISTASHRSHNLSPHSPVSTSTQSRSSHTRSTPSQSTQSTGNRESSDSPMSYGSSTAPSPPPGLPGSVIPMPPRHPQTRGRARTIPAPSAGSPGSQSSASPVAFPGWSASSTRLDSARTRTESDMSTTIGRGPIPFVLDSEDEEPHEETSSLMDVPEAEGSIEEAEQRDNVGLLSTPTSSRASRTSLRQFASGMQRRSNGSRSRSGTTSRSASRSRTTSTNSHSESARSRAQSLIQSLGAASRSSVDLVVRSRAHSMARLSDSPYYSTSPDPAPSSPENNTFGLARRPQPQIDTTQHDDEQSVSDSPSLPSPLSANASHATT